jgi:ketosteroid isomerase-like protein
MSPEQVQAALADYFARLNSMDPDQLMDAFAGDATGNNARRAMFESVTTVFRTLVWEAEHTYIEGNTVAMRWTATGTTMTGNEVAFDGIDILTFDDAGKIETQRSYWYPDALIAELEG